MQQEPAFAREALGGGALGYALKEAADDELVEAVRRAAAGESFLNPRLGARLASEPPLGPPDDLSEREVEVLRLIALGHTNARSRSSCTSACARSRRTARISSRSCASPRAPSSATRSSAGCWRYLQASKLSSSPQRLGGFTRPCASCRAPDVDARQQDRGALPRAVPRRSGPQGGSGVSAVSETSGAPTRAERAERPARAPGAYSSRTRLTSAPSPSISISTSCPGCR